MAAGEYKFNLGTTGQLMILDYDQAGSTGSNLVGFFIRTDRNSDEQYVVQYDEEGNQTSEDEVFLVDQYSWTYTANGSKAPLQTSRIATRRLNFLGAVNVPLSQTLTFHAGETNTSELNGPADFSVYISRSDTLGVGRVSADGGTRRAIPYVNVAGVWRKAEPYAKYAGEWKQTS